MFFDAEPLMASGVAAAVATSTWSTTDKSGIDLTNNNNTATANVGGGAAYVRGSSGKAFGASNGIVQFELQLPANNANSQFGISTTAYNPSASFIGNDTNSFGVTSNGDVYYNYNVVSSIGAVPGNSVLGFVIDTSNGSVSIYINGTLKTTRSANTSGVWFPTTKPYTGGDAITIRHSGFTYPVSGATAWG